MINIRVLSVVVMLLCMVGLADAQTSGAPDEPLHANGGVPRLPNFTGKYICFGIDLPSPKLGWGIPTIESSMQYGGTKAKHRIIFPNGKFIKIFEELARVGECKSVPINVAQWDSDGQSSFCLKSWVQGQLIRVDLQASEKLASGNDLIPVLYGIGACDFGDDVDLNGDYLNYGMTIRVGVTHLHAPVVDKSSENSGSITSENSGEK